MSREYVSAEIDKIFESKEFEAPLDSAMAASWVLGNLKGINLKILDMRDSNSLTDYFVLGSASNTTQAKAMAEEITHQLKRRGLTFLSKEGMDNSDWILLDTGDIIVHIFLDSSRDVYGLEELWKESETIRIPTDYYYSSEGEAEVTSGASKSERDFF